MHNNAKTSEMVHFKFFSRSHEQYIGVHRLESMKKSLVPPKYGLEEMLVLKSFLGSRVV